MYQTVLSVFLVGQCLAPKVRPEGWPVTYKIVRVLADHVEVKTQVEGNHHDALATSKPWYRRAIRTPTRLYEKVACPHERYLKKRGYMAPN